MLPELPPLNAARTFEAAARLLSFTRAADELHVTQAAVSHQIIALEAHLGVKLFRRQPRQLLLTDAGQAFARDLTDVFRRLGEATARLRRVDAGPILTVSVVPSFAARWLVPRLGRFREKHPEIDVRVAPGSEPADFARDDVDVGIRFGSGRYPGLRVDRLMGDEMFPVCAPELRRNLRRPADLRRHVLLHDDSRDDWRAWLAAAGVAGVDAERGPIFTDASMLLSAAQEGQGVALARRVLAAGELRRGTLVRPFALSLSVERAYYLVAPRSTAERPGVKAFREWMLEEVATGSPRSA